MLSEPPGRHSCGFEWAWCCIVSGTLQDRGQRLRTRGVVSPFRYFRRQSGESALFSERSARVLRAGIDVVNQELGQRLGFRLSESLILQILDYQILVDSNK